MTRSHGMRAGEGFRLSTTTIVIFGFMPLFHGVGSHFRVFLRHEARDFFSDSALEVRFLRARGNVSADGGDDFRGAHEGGAMYTGPRARTSAGGIDGVGMAVNLAEDPAVLGCRSEACSRR